MYSTPIDVHNALDVRVQQVSSNRKKSVAPQFKDMIVNAAVEEFINTRLSNMLNYKQKGFEEEIKRYSDLMSLKKETQLIALEVESDRRNKFVLPTDYREHISSYVTLDYNKHGVFDSSRFSDYYYTLAMSTLSDIQLGGDALYIRLNGKTYTYKNVYLQTKSIQGKFYIYNFIVDKLRALGINCKLYDYNGYHQEDTIFVRDNSFEIASSNVESLPKLFNVNIGITASCPDIFTYTNKLYRINNTKGVITSDCELVSSANRDYTLNNYYGSKNRQREPMIDIVGDALYVYKDKTFEPTHINMTYLKKPRLMNVDEGIMPEIEITDEILDIAGKKLSSYLGYDNTYETRVHEKITNE